jgi:hypothetical protein
VTSPALILSGFAVTGPGPSDTINSVTATVNAWTSSVLTGPLAYELHDGKTGALIDSGTGSTSTSTAHYDTVIFGAPVWSQLYWLTLWIYADSGTAPPGTVVSVDYAALSVTYLSSGVPFAAPVAGSAIAKATAPDATGPSGRVFTDITVFVGPTTVNRGGAPEPVNLMMAMAAPGRPAALAAEAGSRWTGRSVSESGAVSADVT